MVIEIPAGRPILAFGIRWHLRRGRRVGRLGGAPPLRPRPGADPAERLPGRQGSGKRTGPLHRCPPRRFRAQARRAGPSRVKQATAHAKSAARAIAPNAAADSCTEGYSNVLTMATDRITPGKIRQLTLAAADNQYQIQSDTHREDPWPDSPDGLLTGEDGWLAVITGAEWGPVEVVVEYRTAAPERLPDDYEMSAERDLYVDNGRIGIREIYAPRAAEVLDAGNGRYRVRVSVSGRWEAFTAKSDSPAERHLVQIWRSEQPAEPATLTSPDRYARNYRGQPPPS
jgi:hypothetical protein